MSTRSRRAWFDWVAVERAIDGQPIGRDLTRAERAHVIARLLRRGRTPTEVAAHLGISYDTARSHQRSTLKETSQ